MAQGADGVELDVMRCSSGELVVCHDEVLTRLAGVRWEVRSTPWWKLKNADVGSALGFAPSRIPLLSEVFEALPPTAFVNVELKCDVADDRGLSAAVAAYLLSLPNPERVFVSSFNPLCLVRFARRAPGLRRGFLIDPDRAWWPQVYGWLPVVAKTSVHPHHLAITPARVNGWHERGWEVAAWTVDDLDEARSLRAMGVEWLITNRPGEVRRALKGFPSSAAR